MFFIAESIQSFSGIIFYAPKIGDISSTGCSQGGETGNCFPQKKPFQEPALI